MKRIIILISMLTAGYFFYGQSMQWSKSYGGLNDDKAYSIRQTADGGFIVAGESNSIEGEVSGNHGLEDAWILRLDATSDTVWTKCYGGSGNDVAYSIQETADGGFIVAGYSESTDGDVPENQGGKDFWILRLDAGGDTLWTKCYGGSGDDVANSILQTTDGGFVVAGYSTSDDGNVSGNHGLKDAWVLRLDTNGNKLWARSYGGSDNNVANCIRQTADGGFVVAGSFVYVPHDTIVNAHGANDYWVFRLDANGITLWTRCYGGSGDDVANDIQETPEGEFIVAGYSHSTDGDVLWNHGGNDYWVLRLNIYGYILWAKCYGSYGDDKACSIQQTADGGFIVAGYSNSTIGGDMSGNHGNYDYWILKLNTTGDTVWTKCYGGHGNDYASVIQQTADGGFVIVGSSDSNDDDVLMNYGNYDYWILKLDNSAGIITQNLSQDVDIYPNPANHQLFVEYNHPFTMEISDIAGKLILKSDTKETDISKIKSGVYIVSIKNKNGLLLKTEKLVIQ